MGLSSTVTDFSGGEPRTLLMYRSCIRQRRGKINKHYVMAAPFCLMLASLSGDLFFCCANSLGEVSPPLQERLITEH